MRRLRLFLFSVEMVNLSNNRPVHTAFGWSLFLSFNHRGNSMKTSGGTHDGTGSVSLL